MVKCRESSQSQKFSIAPAHRLFTPPHTASAAAFEKAVLYLHYPCWPSTMLAFAVLLVPSSVFLFSCFRNRSLHYLPFSTGLAPCTCPSISSAAAKLRSRILRSDRNTLCSVRGRGLGLHQSSWHTARLRSCRICVFRETVRVASCDVFLLSLLWGVVLSCNCPCTTEGFECFYFLYPRQTRNARQQHQ